MLISLKCPERSAEANLRHFPVLHIKYEAKRIEVKIQHHTVFRAKMVRAGAREYCPRTIYELREPLTEVAAFLSTHDEGIIRSKKWDYDSFTITLHLRTPVRIGDYNNIETLYLTYYPWWANTPEMMALRAEWHDRNCT